MPQDAQFECLTDATSVAGLARFVREQEDWQRQLARHFPRPRQILVADATVAAALCMGAVVELVRANSLTVLKRSRSHARILAETWGDLALADITAADLQALESALEERVADQTGRPLTRETVRRVVGMAVKLVGQYRRFQRLEPLPWGPLAPVSPRPPRRVPTLDQVREVLNHFEDPRLQVVLAFIVGCGLRESEVPRERKSLERYMGNADVDFVWVDRRHNLGVGILKWSVVPGWVTDLNRQYFEQWDSEYTSWEEYRPSLRRALALACAVLELPSYTAMDFRLVWQAAARQFGLPRGLVRHGIRPEDAIAVVNPDGALPPERLLALRWASLMDIAPELRKVATVPRAAPRVGQDEPESKRSSKKTTAPAIRF